MDATTPPAPPPHVQELWRRIGRNVLVYQQIELMLKALLANTGFEGPLSEIRARATVRQAQVHAMTLGGLTELYRKEVFEPATVSAEPEQITEPWVRMSVRLECRDPAEVDRLKATLKTLVAKRNALAHNFLQTCDLHDPSDVEAALRQLDTDGDDARAVRGHLKDVLEAAETHRQHAVAELVSPKFRLGLELAAIQISPVAQALWHLCGTATRADGWIDLAHAGHLLHAQLHEDMVNLDRLYGHKRLRDFVIATQMFEVLAELNPPG